NVEVVGQCLDQRFDVPHLEVRDKVSIRRGAVKAVSVTCERSGNKKGNLKPFEDSRHGEQRVKLFRVHGGGRGPAGTRWRARVPASVRRRHDAVPPPSPEDSAPVSPLSSRCVRWLPIALPIELSARAACDERSRSIRAPPP